MSTLATHRLEPRTDRPWAGPAGALLPAASSGSFDRGDAYDAGGDGAAFDPHAARAHLRALTGAERYGETINYVERLPQPWRGHPGVLDFLGQAQLARATSRSAALESVDARAATDRWLSAERLLDVVEQAVRDGRALSLVRVGDGEARFAIGMTRGERRPIALAEAGAMAAFALRNWFGGQAVFDASTWSRVYRLYRRALADADVIGVCSPDRMRRDARHFGLLAWQERWLGDLLDGRRPLWVDALCAREMDAASPFLSRLLAGKGVVGFVSPHPELASRMQRRLGIARVLEHIVPAEHRLDELVVRPTSTRHYPDRFDELMRDLCVPEPGILFLVAAGLLGKIYCARIKNLGGVAVDIGALADAWMGLDTRDGHFSSASSLVRERAPPQPPITGCLSLGKTGSMALTAALRDAGAKDAFHLHYLGSHALSLKAEGSEPMRGLAAAMADKVADPAERFRIVTCVRDPVARLLSQAFYRAAKGARDAAELLRDPAALIESWETSRPDLADAWFDDTLRSTFGFDFRDHSFDRGRRSLRFERERLRLLVLRAEDPVADRERELGWLIDQDRVRLTFHNTAASEGYKARYDEFRRRLKVPQPLLERYYASEVVRRFYSAAEIENFRRMWAA